MNFNGIVDSMGSLMRVSTAKSRSLSPENPTGVIGGGGKCPLAEGSAQYAASNLGFGWKVNPFVIIPPKAIYTIADIEGMGCLQHIWMTPTGNWRTTILRIYWDGQEHPSVECPVGDFFACGWNQYSPLSSLAVCVNPGSAFNCYWQMPFRRNCRITLENYDDEAATYYYQIDYTLTDIPDDCAFFHASFHRTNPTANKEPYTILETRRGRGHYVGTYIAWQTNSAGWWGEGEIKFYLDGDDMHPTICGTGTEDYFCGSYNFENKETNRYEAFTSPYSGLCQTLLPDGLYASQTRFGMYRWHILDPIRFSSDITVTIQALGMDKNGRYLPLRDDIASVAFWYEMLPSSPLPPLPAREMLEVH